MRRLLVRIVGLGLCASALTGCGMMGGGDDTAAAPPAPRNGDITPLAADVSTAVRQAQMMRASGDLDGAMRLLSQLMLGAPDDPRVVGEYGKLLVQQGRAADAVQFLRRAVELQPSDWTLYSAMGVAYDKLNDQANARLAYEHALVLKPGEPAILNNFAMSRMLAGDPVAARTLMLQAQASGSSDPRIASNLALLNTTSPVIAAPALPARALAASPPAQHPLAAAPHSPVASNGYPPLVPAHAAPLPIAPAQVVMQEVPIDPLAGPVGHAAHPAKPNAKPGKPAKAKPATRNLAANAPPKPPKAKPTAHDHIPALRMTADASKP